MALLAVEARPPKPDRRWLVRVTNAPDDTLRGSATGSVGAPIRAHSQML